MQFTADVSDAGLIGNAVSFGNLVFTADKNGRIHAVNRDGEKQWAVETENGRNENSYPVVAGNSLYFTGANEMVKVRTDRGTIVSRTPLSGDSAHLFGRRVVPYDGAVLMPTNGSIRILDQASGELRKEISIPGGSRMTPAIWGDRIITVNQQGTLLIIDPDSSSVEGEIPTAGMQPVALAPSVREDRAVFSGRKGTVVCVNLAQKSVVWERDLPGESVSVFSDPECSPQGVYIFAGTRIFGLSMEDGSDLFSPISDATSPPLYRNGTILFGTSGGGLTVADADSGERRGGVDTDEVITTRPVQTGRSVVAGTEDGTVLVMSP
jgi:outer membrane protein assembly factor BamB